MIDYEKPTLTSDPFFIRPSNSINYLKPHGFVFKQRFEWVFNLCFFICLGPFRTKISRSSGKHYMGNLLQKTICAVLHIACLGHSVSQILSIISKPLEKNPSKVFWIAIKVTTTAVNWTLVLTLWTQMKDVSYFMNKVPQSSSTVKEWLIFALLVSYPLGEWFSDIFLSCWALFTDSSPKFWISIAHPLEDWNLSSSSTLKGRNMTLGLEFLISEQGLTEGEKFWAALGLILTILNELLLAISQIMVSLTVMAISEIIYKRLRFLGEMKGLKNQVYVDFYLETEAMINKINDLFGSVTLAVYCFMVAFIPANYISIGSMFTHSTFVTIRLFLAISYHLGIMILASLAYNKGGDFRELFLHKTLKPLENGSQGRMPDGIKNEGLSETFLAYLDMTEGNLGVRGGDFFTFSFGFLGATSCFCLTFVLVLIQFKPTQGIAA